MLCVALIILVNAIKLKKIANCLQIKNIVLYLQRLYVSLTF